MNSKRIFLMFMMALFLSGCTFMPKYTRPQSPVSPELPRGEAYADSRAAMEALPAAHLKWEDVFQDKKLQNVVQLALLNNRDLHIAVLNVERARAYYGVRQAELFPVIDASASGSKTLTPVSVSRTGSDIYAKQYSVNLGITSWEIDLFGRIRSLKKQALEEYLATEEVQRAARSSLITETAIAYLTLAADMENLKLAQATLEVQRSVYGLIWQQYDKGIVGETDLRRSQTQVDTAARDIARYTQNVARERNNLDLLAGCAVPQEFLPGSLSDAGPFKDIYVGISSDVLLRRADIMAAEHRLKAAYAFIGAARAAFFPSISLTNAIGSSSNEFSGLFTGGTKAWSFAAQAAAPIFDMRTAAAYRVSKAERDIALTQYEKAIQSAFREVADALAVRGTIDQEVAAQESIVDSTAKIYKLSGQRYAQGIDNYLSVLDAQRSLYSAQQQLTLLRLVKEANRARFYSVLGGDAGK